MTMTEVLPRSMTDEHRENIERGKQMLEEAYIEMWSRESTIRKFSIEMQRHGNKSTGPYLTTTRG